MRKYFRVVIQELKKAKCSWKTYLSLGLIFEYYKNDRDIEEDMYGHSYHKTFILSSNTDETVNKNLNLL